MLSIFKSKKINEKDCNDPALKLESCVDPVEELRDEDLLLVSGGYEGGIGGGGYGGGGGLSYTYS